MAIKFEHHSSKGCPGGGPPNEWAVYQALGETHGIPRLFFKGSLADFYIMARGPPDALLCSFSRWMAAPMLGCMGSVAASGTQQLERERGRQRLRVAGSFSVPWSSDRGQGERCR